MSKSTLVRWSGIALIVAGLLVFVTDLVSAAVIWGFGPEPAIPFSEAVALPSYVVLTSVYLVISVLAMLGIIGLYAHQADNAGVFGLIAFVVFVLGIMLSTGATFTATFVPPVLADVAPAVLDAEETGTILDAAFGVSYILFPLGLVLVTISTLINQAVPRVFAIIALVGFVVGFALQMVSEFGIVFLVSSALTAGAVASLGFGLWNQSPTTSATT